MKPHDPGTSQRVKLYPKPPDFVPVPDFPQGHRYEGRRRCQKWSARNNRQCLGHAMRGKTFCYTHGGATPVGIAAPSWKHGGYSKYLPSRLVDHYTAAAKDPDLLSLVGEIALWKSRIYDLLSRVDTGEAGFYWQQAQAAHSELVKALQRKHNEAVADSLSSLNRILARGVSDYAAWSEIRGGLLTLQRLEESEQTDPDFAPEIGRAHD